jgi:hypothetical protein
MLTPRPSPTRWLSVLLLLIALPLSTSATQIYKHTDAQGNVTYSDQPPAPGETAEEIRLPSMNTTAPPPVIARPPAAEEDRQPPPAPEIRIVSPEDESTIAMGPGNVSVSAQASPPLGPREQVRLLLDGEPVGAPGQSTTWDLQGLLRGPHQLRVERLDREGEPVARSDNVRIYVLRPSVNQPLR